MPRELPEPPLDRAHCGTGARLRTTPVPRGPDAALYSGRPQTMQGGARRRSHGDQGCRLPRDARAGGHRIHRHRPAARPRGPRPHRGHRRLSQRPARGRRRRPFRARPRYRARPRGSGHRRGGRRSGDGAPSRRPRGGVSLRLLRKLRPVPQRSPQCLRRGAVARSESAPPRLSKKGQGIPSFAGIGSYAERMLLHENSVVKIDDDLPLDRAALVGCGVLTGVGAALRSAGLEAGQTVAVFGCGGVGLSIVQGARIGGARQIIALDRFDSKLEMARRVGATHVVNTLNDDPVEAVRALTGGAGVDHAFEAVGNTTLVRQAIESLAIRGTATIVGVLPPDAKIEFPWMAIRPECRVQTSRMGSNRFRVDIPRYLEFYRQGRLLLDEMVTRRGRLDDINEAFRAMKAGEVARTVLLFE